MTKIEKILTILIILFGINLLVLDYKTLFPKKGKEETKEPVKEVTKGKKPVGESDINFCPEPCLTKIKEATSSITLKPGEKVVEKVVEKQTTRQTAESGLKEFFIPLVASGSTTEGGWKDIAGMEVTIDRSKYPDKITVNWQAALKVKDGNGEAHARLFNITKNVAVDYSEITSIGADFKNVTSNNINLSSGNNLYRVQMFSTTQYEVFIQGARIKITVE